jgi:hypothetical protein
MFLNDVKFNINELTIALCDIIKINNISGCNIPIDLGILEMFKKKIKQKKIKQ